VSGSGLAWDCLLTYRASREDAVEVRALTEKCGEMLQPNDDSSRWWYTNMEGLARVFAAHGAQIVGVSTNGVMRWGASLLLGVYDGLVPELLLPTLDRLDAAMRDGLAHLEKLGSNASPPPMP